MGDFLASMRRAILLVLLAAAAVLLPARFASAVCPPDCVGGGGPAATDCVVTWAGIASTTASCVDGTACDTDGTADGVCTFPLSACLGVDPSCGVTTSATAKVVARKLADGPALQSAIQALSPGQCTEPGFRVPVKWKAGTTTPIKPGKARVRVIASADGKKDPDVLTLTCEPARPGLAAAIQPLFTAHCTDVGCHGGVAPQVPDLNDGAAYASLVGQPSTESKLPYVTPGTLKRSWLTAKLLGAKGTTRMPLACGTPGVPCLTVEETYRVFAWIQAGAPQ